jgi:HTH-type transcriptional repressor of NAD biosynthesis genes
MTRGLVIGKFLPIHRGHIAMIEFALLHCDELIVSMSYTPTDAIDASLRFNWIKEIFKDQPRVLPRIIADDFDDEQLPLNERTRQWAVALRNVYPQIDVIISSEEYGASFAANMNATHISFDPNRRKIPVSASLIRQQPFKFWEYIPDQLKSYFVKKICFYGPESTGKSTMAKAMAEKYKTEFVPEVARELIQSNEFSLEDIIRIGRAQTERVKEKSKTANKILFCDTDLITTQIYSQHYLKQIPPELFELEKEINYDKYFLFDIDVEWVADGLRDLGDQRQHMLNTFRTELEKRKIPYTWVRGSYQERAQIIQHEIDLLLNPSVTK